MGVDDAAAGLGPQLAGDPPGSGVRGGGRGDDGAGYETGYLALLPLLVLPLVAGRPPLAGVRRAAVVGAGSLLADAWVIAPLLAQRHWAARPEPLHGTGLVNGYGAGKVLGWRRCSRALAHANQSASGASTSRHPVCS